MHSTKKWDFSHPKNRLGKDRDIVSLIISWVLFRISQLIEYCGIVHYYAIISVCNPVTI